MLLTVFLFSGILLRFLLMINGYILWLFHGYLKRWRSPYFQGMKFEYTAIRYTLQVNYVKSSIFLLIFFCMWFVMNRKLNSSFCTHMSLQKCTYTINCGHVSRLFASSFVAWYKQTLCLIWYKSPSVQFYWSLKISEKTFYKTAKFYKLW